MVMHHISEPDPPFHVAYQQREARGAQLSILTRPRVRLEPALDARALVAKRAFDVVIAVTAILFLAPVLLVAALAILIDSRGPVLFRQQRIGKDGRVFLMFKLRTMIEERRKRAVPLPVAMDRRRAHKTRRDPRVTRVGRFLRRTCVDEVPQLWNVLRGDMSLVGPRPELPEIVATYEPWQHQRHLVAPGITGWWQVNRDGTRLMHQSTELDLYYVEHWSLKLDVIILARTLLIVLRGVGAF